MEGGTERGTGLGTDQGTDQGTELGTDRGTDLGTAGASVCGVSARGRSAQKPEKDFESPPRICLCNGGAGGWSQGARGCGGPAVVLV